MEDGVVEPPFSPVVPKEDVVCTVIVELSGAEVDDVIVLFSVVDDSRTTLVVPVSFVLLSESGVVSERVVVAVATSGTDEGVVEPSFSPVVPEVEAEGVVACTALVVLSGAGVDSVFSVVSDREVEDSCASLVLLSGAEVLSVTVFATVESGKKSFVVLSEGGVVTDEREVAETDE